MIKTKKTMKTCFYLRAPLVTALILFLCNYTWADGPTIEYGDGIIVFEAEAASYSDSHWKLRVPEDPEYEKYVTHANASGIAPVNNTYLQYIGGWNGQTKSMASAINYTFTCQKTGDYQLAARLLQPLKDGEPGDASNDFFIKMSGTFTSASKFEKADLEKINKFWGRGINQWGTAQYLEHNGSDLPIYHFTAGETYTLTLVGRSQHSCIDYLILFDINLKLEYTNNDLALQNHPYFRPGGPASLGDKVAKIIVPYSSIYVSEVDEIKPIPHTVYPETAENKSIIWQSSNENIVTVDENGVMTGISEGKATISAVSDDGGAELSYGMEVGKYLVTFDDYVSYDQSAKNYFGQNNINWEMRSSSTIRFNSTTSIQVSKGVAAVKAAKIPGGIKGFSVEVKHLYLTDAERTVELLVNGNVVGSITNTTTGKYDFVVDDIFIEGEFSLVLRNATKSEELKAFYIMFDNMTWTPIDPVDITREDQEVTGFHDQNVKDITLYPNPTRGLDIELTGLESGSYQVIFYDLLGAVAYQTQQEIVGNSTSINTESIPSGTYILSIEGENIINRQKVSISN